MRRILFPCLALGLTSAAIAAGEPVSSSAGVAGLDALSAYAGSWRTEIHYLDTPYSQKRDTSYELRNDCWRSAGFYACDQFVGGESKALLIYTYDPAHGYSSYPIPVGAGEVHAGHLEIQGKVWTFPWKTVKDGKTTYFHVTNTWDSPDSIQFRQEYSPDGQQWLLMAEGHETRIK
ncbi:MAG: hypothetical protein ACHQAZ_03330 [Gammaproteobacteria bacterium]